MPQVTATRTTAMSSSSSNAGANGDRRHRLHASPKPLPAHYQLYKTARCLAEQGFSDIVTGKHANTNSASPVEAGGGGGTSTSHQSNAKEENNSRFFKTRLCLFHQKGACVRGTQCSYAHDERELKAPPNLIKTRLCQDWLNGRCSAENCKFAHGRHELRFTHDYFKTKLCHFWQQGGCTKGDLCRHAHGEEELRPMPEGAEQDPSMPLNQQESPSTSSTTTAGTSKHPSHNHRPKSGSGATTPKHHKNGGGSSTTTRTTSPILAPISAAALAPTSHETTYTGGGGMQSGCSTVNREDELEYLRYAPAAVEEQPMIPRPGKALDSEATHTTSNSPASREAAVIEALRLAEEARRLVARSTELLTGSVDGPPAPASAPPAQYQVAGNVSMPVWSTQSRSSVADPTAGGLYPSYESIIEGTEGDLLLDDILGQNDIGDLADLLTKLLMSPDGGSTQYC